jgi:hypothetical protein
VVMVVVVVSLILVDSCPPLGVPCSLGDPPLS